MKKHIATIFGIFTLLLTGCQQPGEVELKPSDETAALEANPVVLPDTNVEMAPVDSFGVLPGDRLRFGATFIVNSVVLDFGPGAVVPFSYSQVAVTNVDSAIRVGNTVVGYRGFNLGNVYLNGVLMDRYVRWVPVHSSLVDFGWEYGVNLTRSYVPNRLYTWTALPLAVGNVNVAIQTPDSLDVLSPRGGTIIPRNRDLTLRWKGRGNISIVVSWYDKIKKKSWPLLELKPRSNHGQAVIPAKLLSVLPPKRDFVFTFILSNRKETTVVQRYTGKILVQAASVYNSYVELR
jgi:hypothetical protein